MDAFVAWNLRLLESFFSPASRGDEVWLAIDPVELGSIGPDLGGDVGFLEAVRNGPPWPTIKGSREYVSRGTSADLVARALGLCSQRLASPWRPSGYVDPGQLSPVYLDTRAPTYLPFLVALVRACSEKDEDGFYACLREALQLGPNWGSVAMAQLRPVWRDLETWTDERGGSLGRFTLRRLGGLRQIGIPQAQSIVSRRDVSMLTRVFAQAGVLPGQPVSANLISSIRSIAREAPYLSRAFLDALWKPEFLEPVNERLRSLLDEWDGRVVGAGVVARDGSSGTHTQQDEVQIALGLANGNSLPWQIRWRVAAQDDAGSITLTAEAQQWRARMNGESVVTTAREFPSGCSLLAISAIHDVELQAEVNAGDAEGEARTTRSMILKKRPLRTLILDTDDTGSGSVILVERPLPANGPAYLLCCPVNRQNVDRFLYQNEVNYEVAPNEGLPDGWSLIFLPDCGSIGEASRNDLPDGLLATERQRPRVLRLVGGRVIHRAGLRQFLPYDLPAVELDAPFGTELCASGLDLLEQHRMSEPVLNGIPSSRASLRRFSITVRDPESRSFEIAALNSGERIDSVRLRLAPADGLQWVAGTAFSLNRLGYPQPNDDGLRGAVLHANQAALAHTSQSCGVSEQALGYAIGASDGISLARHPGVELLDSLAQAGSIEYGRARDQLRRLIARYHQLGEYEVLAIMRELSARGMLEIEVDAKGRWARVHSASPTIYLLPVESPAGHVVAGIAGSLRLAQWNTLAASARYSVRPTIDVSATAVVPVLRLIAPSVEALRDLGAEGGFEVVNAPAPAIAYWAAGLDQVRSAMDSRGVESLGSGLSEVEWYRPASGEFIPSGDAVVMRDGLDHQLFRFEDGETGRHRLYSLGVRTHDGRSRYAFVRDPRWGVWAALQSFANFARRYGIEDASPWPFPYASTDNCVWLPARISLPVVLERALVLCSGGAPVRTEISRAPQRQQVLLEYRSGTGAVGVVSPVYDLFVPRHPRWAAWLGYRWVPDALAREVAAKLGGQLQYIVE